MKKRLLLLSALGLVGIGSIVMHQIVVSPVQADAEETFILDVACDGRTGALNRVDPSATTSARGDVGIVNGFIFPVGTIPPGDNAFDLDTPRSIGDWVCL